MQSLQRTAAALLTGTSGPVLAHAGLDKSSATMVALHALAHAINDHPVVVILLMAGLLALGGAITRTYERYRAAQSKRRH